jgi:hypothetical protein
MTRSGSLVLRYRLTPWWARVLVVFVLSRVVSTIALLTFAGAQEANAWTLASPDYGSFATIWDGHWYYIIAAVGYHDDGHVGENAWAFMPVYPFVVRGLMTLTGLPFATLAVVVSVACAAGTALLFYRLMRHSLPESTSLFAVVLFCVAPLSPLLQVAYAESMFLLLLCASLLLLVRRRYLTMLPVVLVMSFTRPGALPLALAIGLHGVLRWWRRHDDPFPARERVRVVAAAAATAAFGVAWLIVAGAVTGVPGAYTETELAWRAPYIGPLGRRGELVVSGWFRHRPARPVRARLHGPDAVAVGAPDERRPETVGRRLRALPAGRVLPAVQYLQAPDAALPPAGRARGAALEGLPRAARRRVRGGPVGVALLLLVGERVRLDAAVIGGRTASFRSGAGNHG